MLKRSEVHDSTVSDESSVRRSRVSRSRVAHSRVKRSALTECDVANCILIRTDFKGMVLRNGVWKNGRLIGRMGHTEVVAVGGDEKASKKINMDKIVTKDPQVWMKEDVDSDSSDDEGVDLKDRNRNDDLPPPYSP